MTFIGIRYSVREKRCPAVLVLDSVEVTMSKLQRLLLAALDERFMRTGRAAMVAQLLKWQR
jgi:hypothetical protein